MARIVNDVATALPLLREEVHCLQGPVQFDGAPSWTLHDPTNNRFFRIGWAEYEMLARWSLADPERIASGINAETTLQVDSGGVKQLAHFLLANQLLYPGSEQALRQLWQQVQAGKKSLGSRLLHNYLFFKIPLFHPDALLTWLYPRLAWIYSRGFACVVLGCALLGLYLVSRQWEQFINTFPHFFNWKGLSQYFLALIFAKILHEFGHALTAHRFGCRVPTMGVAFMVMYPMLYTDANEIWKLNSRRQRLAVASAGILAELGLAAFATLAWSFLDDGPVRSAVFLLASSTWIMTLVINLSPFMRFDGYYLLADSMKIENLQPRAFAYTLWQLRQLLLGLDMPPPERVPPRIARFFVIYSWSTWLYRLLLFIGIAWMVYLFFFKLLGIFLMAVEIGWFIVRPIWRELKHWPALVRGQKHWLRPALLAGAVSAVLWVPWQQHLELPAHIKPARYTELYLPYSARLESWHVAIGDQVVSGQVLATLSSSELTYKALSSGLETDTLAWQVSYQGIDHDHLKQRQIQLRQWESAAAKQSGFRRQLEQLRIRAPLTGTVQEINEQLQAGQWLKAGERLLIVADTSEYTVEAYVGEQDIMHVVDGADGAFYPDNPDLPTFSCRLQSVDGGNTQNLPDLLVSTYGGPIAVRPQPEQKHLPGQAQYRLTLKVLAAPPAGIFSPQVLRGTLRLDTEASSLAQRLWRQLLAGFWREAGF